MVWSRKENIQYNQDVSIGDGIAGISFSNEEEKAIKWRCDESSLNNREGRKTDSI